MPVAPLIAVAPYRLAPGRVPGWSDGSEAVPFEYLDGLRRAGSVPVVVGGTGSSHPSDLLGSFAGLVLVGGGDVAPARYGEDRGPAVYGTDVVRDDFEISLVRAALRAGMPTFGICRGAQVLNVALGGSLWQHLADLDLPTAHGTPDGTIVPVTHPVDVLPGSRLAGLVGGVTRIERCVSIHHQSVRRLGAGLLASAWSPDGQIEAVEPEAGGTWCVAVQWHPERSAATDPVQQGLFDGFVQAVLRG